FFTIPLHPGDCDCFAFSLPTINNSAPMQRYHWTVLPQGMMNSPTISQIVVAAAIQPTREAFPMAVVYHYMDDILVATKESQPLMLVMNHLI
ncbi:POK11 protein, partial [Eurystomus gularis]|nr:POK11 protein [Eurystomus gularis]